MNMHKTIAPPSKTDERIWGDVWAAYEVTRRSRDDFWLDVLRPAYHAAHAEHSPRPALSERYDGYLGEASIDFEFDDPTLEQELLGFERRAAPLDEWDIAYRDALRRVKMKKLSWEERALTANHNHRIFELEKSYNCLCDEAHKAKMAMISTSSPSHAAFMQKLSAVSAGSGVLDGDPCDVEPDEWVAIAADIRGLAV